MDSPSLPMFCSISAECEYWKLRSQKYLEALMEVKNQYNEFIEESHGIETEMDATLDQMVKKIKELTTKADINEREKEALVVKLNSKSSEMSTMTKQLASVTNELQSMKVDVRILEQSNDRLEQAHRIACESKEIVENQLFEQYEKYALLEMEVEEKCQLEEEVQRLKDEARDLRQELRTRDLQLELRPVTMTVASQVDGDDCLEFLNSVKHRKAARRQITITPRNYSKQELEASQIQGAGDSLETMKAEDQLEVSSMGSNFQFLICKTVREMVSKLDNLQAKLRAHREKRPLPRTSAPAS